MARASAARDRGAERAFPCERTGERAGTAGAERLEPRALIAREPRVDLRGARAQRLLDAGPEIGRRPAAPRAIERERQRHEPRVHPSPVGVHERRAEHEHD